MYVMAADAADVDAQDGDLLPIGNVFRRCPWVDESQHAFTYSYAGTVFTYDVLEFGDASIVPLGRCVSRSRRGGRMSPSAAVESTILAVLGMPKEATVVVILPRRLAAFIPPNMKLEGRGKANAKFRRYILARLLRLLQVPAVVVCAAGWGSTGRIWEDMGGSGRIPWEVYFFTKMGRMFFWDFSDLSQYYYFCFGEDWEDENGYHQSMKKMETSPHFPPTHRIPFHTLFYPPNPPKNPKINSLTRVHKLKKQ